MGFIGQPSLVGRIRTAGVLDAIHLAWLPHVPRDPARGCVWLLLMSDGWRGHKPRHLVAPPR
jgi:hypothetical protein